MSDLDMNKIVGESFEDMSISQMTLIQGSGDTDPKAITSSLKCIQISIEAATYVTATVSFVKTIASKC